GRRRSAGWSAIANLGGVAAGADHRRQPGVDDRFQRRISHGRWRVLLSIDAARRVQPVRAALRRVAGAYGRGHAAAICARVRRIRLARAHSQRQRRPVCQSRCGRPLGARGLVDPLGHPAGTDRAGTPEQNGSHEQFHRVLKAETARPPAPNCTAQQQRFGRFVREDNEERPHEAGDNEPPARHYTSSPRVLPPRLPAIDYPGHMEVRLVSSNGCISWRNAALFIATPLAGHPIAFEEVDDGLWTVHFATVALARYDE